MVRSKMMMVAAVLAIAVLATPCFAQDVNEGQWINLFDGESLYGFNNLGDVNWAVENGVITATDGYSGMLATTSRFANFELQAKVKVAGKRAFLGLAVRASMENHHTETGAAALTFSEQDSKDWMDVNVKVVGSDISATVDGKAVKGLEISAKKGFIILPIFY